jgi:hypothetical protein
MLDTGPRAIAAGFPEKLHVAFDASHVRLAQVWRGRFFDAAGVASGRTDTFLGPLGEDVLSMPPGPAFAVLESRSAPWPAAKREERNIGGRFRGYILDKQRRPVFRYTLGGVDIREQPLPVVQPGGAILVRQFELRAESGAAPHLYFLGAVGRQIEPMADGSYLVDGQMTVRLESDAPLKPFVRKQPRGSELILPVPREEETTFRVTIRW